MRNAYRALSTSSSPSPVPADRGSTSACASSDVEMVEQVLAMRRTGAELEYSILERQTHIRQLAEPAIGEELVDARCCLLGALNHLMQARAGVKGRSDKAVEGQLTMLAAH